MALSALDDLTQEPTQREVESVLGAALGVWSSLKAWCDAEGAVDSWAWGSSGKKYGWALRGKLRKRTTAYLIPQHGSFLVGLVLGDRAIAAVHEATLSPAVTDVISSAERYGEGTGFRLPVATAEDLEDIRTLIGIKLAY